jgi:hypothetical protein
MAKEATKTETKLKLDPPEALNPVAPAEASRSPRCCSWWRGDSS